MPSKIRSDKMVVITVEMTETQAYALAQFLKRASWVHFRENAVDDADANTMVSAGGCVRRALAEAGFAPR